MQRIEGKPDSSMSARVVTRRALLHDDGADLAIDRPAHVRAGSGLVLAAVDGGALLCVVQDDAAFLALVDPQGVGGRGTRAIALPVSDGVRLFDAGRGNKAAKLDLESAIVEGSIVYAFGSGSTARRERVAVVDVAARTARIVDAPQLYAAARAALGNVELNIEGAVLQHGALRLFHRGNGAGEGNTDAALDLPWPLVRAYLDDPAQPCPPVRRALAIHLGRIDGVRLTVTDAAVRSDDAVVFLAAAEASPNAVDDGPVAGAAIGVLTDRAARWTTILDERGAPLRSKPEGLCLDPDDPRAAWIVVDVDDPDQPTLLMRLTFDLG